MVFGQFLYKIWFEIMGKYISRILVKQKFWSYDYSWCGFAYVQTEVLSIMQFVLGNIYEYLVLLDGKNIQFSSNELVLQIKKINK